VTNFAAPERAPAPLPPAPWARDGALLRRVPPEPAAWFALGGRRLLVQEAFLPEPGRC
jgi:hypothetical protein